VEGSRSGTQVRTQVGTRTHLACERAPVFQLSAVDCSALLLNTQCRPKQQVGQVVVVSRSLGYTLLNSLIEEDPNQRHMIADITTQC
jgi:hypothetical protein